MIFFQNPPDMNCPCCNDDNDICFLDDLEIFICLMCGHRFRKEDVSNKDGSTDT